MPAFNDKTLIDIIWQSGKCQVHGPFEYRQVTGFAPIDKAREQELTFTTDKEAVKTTKAITVLCPKDTAPVHGKVLICVDNPKLWFVRLLKEFFPVGGPMITMGRNVHVAQGVKLGEEGFGYVRNEKGELEKVPHYGGVIIGNDVDILANSCIARGSLDFTEIGDGTKIDQLVHISHNVKVGKHCLITAGTFVGGSATIGDYAEVWANATIFDHVKVGHHSVVGAGAVVRHDVEPFDVVAGNPARVIRKNR